MVNYLIDCLARMDMNLPDLKLLPNIFSRFPEIRAVYLFGSVAEGHLHAESDLDLAIFPRSPDLRKHKLDLLTELAIAGFCNVDLVFLDTDDIVLKFEAIRPNQLIYAAVDYDHASTYSLIVRQYLDFLPYLEVQREAYKRRVLNGEE